MSPSIADSRRETILLSSLRLLDSEGIEAISMARIAKESALSRPAVYQYFSSKENILGELLINDMADLSNEVDRIVGAVDNPMEQVRLWIHYSLAHMASREHRVVREISIKNLREDQRGELMAMHGMFLTSLISPLKNLGVEDPSSVVSMIYASLSSAAERIASGKSFISEAASVEKFVVAGINSEIPS
jgi:AcrR family transcriptional regulator